MASLTFKKMTGGSVANSIQIMAKMDKQSFILDHNNPKKFDLPSGEHVIKLKPRIHIWHWHFWPAKFWCGNAKITFNVYLKENEDANVDCWLRKGGIDYERI